MKTGLFSTQRRRILLLAAVAVLAGLFFLWPRGPREPVYQEKTFTQWLKQATTLTFEGDASDANPPDAEALAALHAIGTNAVPFLLHDFTRPVSAWRQRFNAWAGGHPSLKFRLRDDRKLIGAAGLGLRWLGTNAAPALPVVARYLDDPLRALDVVSILSNKGDAAMPYLAAAISSTNAAAARNAVSVLRVSGLPTATARATCAAALRHPEAGVRQLAVIAWSFGLVASTNVVPDLVKLAEDPSPLVRQEAIHQLTNQSIMASLPNRIAASNALLTLRPNAPPPRAP